MEVGGRPNESANDMAYSHDSALKGLTELWEAPKSFIKSEPALDICSGMFGRNRGLLEILRDINSTCV